MYDSTKFTSNLMSHCRVGTGFTKSANDYSALRCYRALDGFVIAGFAAIPASTSLTIYFYVQSTTVVTASPITVSIFGVYRDNTTSISSAVIRDVTHTAGTFATGIGRL